MNIVGRSTLVGQEGKLIGFGFAPHPVFPNSFLEVIFYQTNKEFVICMSEGTGKGDPETQKEGLGELVAGELFAPYAHRSVAISNDMDYEKFKALMMETLPESIKGLRMEWLK